MTPLSFEHYVALNAARHNIVPRIAADTAHRVILPYLARAVDELQYERFGRCICDQVWCLESQVERRAWHLYWATLRCHACGAVPVADRQPFGVLCDPCAVSVLGLMRRALGHPSRWEAYWRAIDADRLLSPAIT